MTMREEIRDMAERIQARGDAREIERLRHERGEAQRAHEVTKLMLKTALVCLNQIASWDEGAEVSESFDEPNAARMARDGVTAVAFAAVATEVETKRPRSRRQEILDAIAIGDADLAAKGDGQ
jgi:hypothetical protein